MQIQISRLFSDALKKVERKTIKNAIVHWLHHTNQGFAYEFGQAFLSIVSCIFYVVGTYQGLDAPKDDWLVVAEITLATLFTGDFLLRLYVADMKMKYLKSKYALIDIVTVLPVWLSLLVGTQHSALSTGLFFLRPLRVLRAIRLLYVLPAYANASVAQQQLIILLFSLSSGIFVVAGFIQVVENYPDLFGGTQQKLFFHEAIYFMVVTITTVGYGDISPKTIAGRMLIMCVIATTAFLLPMQVKHLMDQYQIVNAMGGELVLPDDYFHIVIAGQFSSQSIEGFLKEFYNEDHMLDKSKVAIFSADSASHQLMRLLNHPFYEDRVVFIRGSVANSEDMKRLKLERAKAVLILNDPLETYVKEVDRVSILRALAFEKHTFGINDEMRLFTHFLSAESTKFVSKKTGSLVIAEDVTTMHLLANNVLCPGYSTLVSNFLKFNRADSESTADWQKKYYHGASQDIFMLRDFGDVFHGRMFGQVAQYIFHELDIVLFAIEAPPENLKRGDAKGYPGQPGGISSETDTASETDDSHVRVEVDSKNTDEDVPETKDDLKHDLERRLKRVKSMRLTNGKETLNWVVLISPVYHRIHRGDRAFIIAPSNSAMKALLYLSPALRIDLESGALHDSSIRKSFEYLKHNEEESGELAIPSRPSRHQLAAAVDNMAKGGQTIFAKVQKSLSLVHIREGVGRIPLQDLNVILVEDASGFSDHVLVCRWPRTIHSFRTLLKVLSTSSIPRKLVVICSQDFPYDRTCDMLFPDVPVHHIFGDPESTVHLARAGAATAYSVMVLSTGGLASDLKTDLDSRDFVTDAHTVLILRALQAVRDETRRWNVISEFADIENARFAEADGFYVEKSVNIQMLLASGRVLDNNLVERCMCRSIYSHEITSLLPILISGRCMDPRTGAHRRFLYQVPVPEQFDGETYVKLFDYFLVQFGAICVGLFRRVSPYDVIQDDAERQPFVGAHDVEGVSRVSIERTLAMKPKEILDMIRIDEERARDYMLVDWPYVFANPDSVEIVSGDDFAFLFCLEDVEEQLNALC